MADVVETARLTHDGALKILHAAIDKAVEMGVPQCIAVVDAGGHLLAFARMDDAKTLSIDSSIAKAATAASGRIPTGGIGGEVAPLLASATRGKLTNLPGGLPVIVEAECIGAIGVGSGKGPEDLEVAHTGLAALPGAISFGP